MRIRRHSSARAHANRNCLSLSVSVETYALVRAFAERCGMSMPIVLTVIIEHALLAREPLGITYPDPGEVIEPTPSTRRWDSERRMFEP